MRQQLEIWENAGSAAPCAQPALAPADPQTSPGPRSATKSAKIDLLSTLQRQISQIETAGRPKTSAISSGIPPLDQQLPHGGFPPGSLVEWITAGAGSPAGWLALVAARSALEHSGGRVVIVDREQTFYPPAAIACGLPAAAFIVLRPSSRSDAMWAIDQSLRCPDVAAVWGHLDRIDDNEARRLQLAAETGGTLGQFTRPPGAIQQPSWAEVRMQITGQSSQQQSSGSRRLSLRLLRVRDSRPGKAICLEIDQQTGTIRQVIQRDSATNPQRLAAELARPAVTRRERSRRA